MDNIAAWGQHHLLVRMLLLLTFKWNNASSEDQWCENTGQSLHQESIGMLNNNLAIIRHLPIWDVNVDSVSVVEKASNIRHWSIQQSLLLVETSPLLRTRHRTWIWHCVHFLYLKRLCTWKWFTKGLLSAFAAPMFPSFFSFLFISNSSYSEEDKALQLCWNSLLLVFDVTSQRFLCCCGSQCDLPNSTCSADELLAQW